MNMRISRMPLGRILLVVATVFFFSGCELLTNARFMDRFKRQGKPQDSFRLSEQGIGKLAKGEMLQAQTLFDKALQRNPRDVHALLGKGIIMLQTGQPVQARNAFEAVLALRPGESSKLIVLNNLQPRSVSDLASMNLALLKNSGLSGVLAMDNDQAGQARGALSQHRKKQSNHALPQFKKHTKQSPAVSMVSQNDVNVIARFVTLKKLRDEGLMTPGEYDVRRKANLGALLTITQPPPAAGLERSVPSAELIIQRLSAIGRALELRAITVRQHGAERKTIVDGLLPSSPKSRATPVPAPKGLLASADAIRRIEMLSEKGLISPQESTREKAAIEKSLALMTAPKQKKVAIKKKVKAVPKGPQPAVHIASFRSRKAADRGWAQLRRAHRALLDKLRPEITRVNLGGKKGVFFRLVAGPLKSNADADQICRQLKRRRQYCEPAFMAGG
ncbi:MAG: tetratricopeptide repeat protein [Pseudomonadota bacterium]|nr:tetratricopeptide repeat protein [Pseudomonadota bacterium]